MKLKTQAVGRMQPQTLLIMANNDIFINFLKCKSSCNQDILFEKIISFQ